MTDLLQHCHLPFDQGKIQKGNCLKANRDVGCTTGIEKKEETNCAGAELKNTLVQHLKVP